MSSLASSELKLLLHCCCAACALVALSELKEQSNGSVTLLFDAPNVTDPLEAEHRRRNLADLAAREGYNLQAPEHSSEPYLEIALPLETAASLQYDPDPERRARKRCRRCYLLQLGRAAQAAREGGFAAFSTTLLVSPYQWREEIISTGATVGQTTGVEFLEFDGRKKAFFGKQRSRALGYHLPNECGCSYSETDGEMPRLH